ncbi:TRAP transporter large permease [Tropicimonas sp. IMCC6043]|uniref:TRAP transporter large permease n=1 Tax=Tropicimonas sp. IMCC6043 TaxID=2510645 RepID=UPI00101D70E0|nr:TRAP transporter large permease [Tropicimonas sp. IMCC6043]RYH06164.1 TRAP transporter large permease [Tropicimonas sp. IMCC6043]
MATFILVGGLFGLLLLGMPVAFSLLLSSLALILYEGKLPLLIVAQRLANALDSFPLLAIPLFILAAEIMNNSGATERIFRLANTILGRIRGGLGHVNIAASMLFSGMSGSAVADAAGLGAIEIRAMKKAGYDNGFAAAVTAASSTIGPIIPPSVPIVLFGVISGASIGDLFLAGFVPGILMGLAMMAYIAVIAKRRNFPRDEAFAGLPAIFSAFIEAFPSLLLPVIILGGIWGGIMSPTEAAAAAVLYSLFLGIVVHRTMRIRDFIESIRLGARSTATIMLIVASANIYGWLVSTQQIPQAVQGMLMTVTSDPTWLLIIIAIVLLIMGMFMELIAILAIAVPVFLPVAVAAGVDVIHFGIVTVLTLMIGLLTPPFGLNLFIVQQVSGAPYGAILKETWPFITILILLLIPVIVFPSISLFLVDVFSS